MSIANQTIHIAMFLDEAKCGQRGDQLAIAGDLEADGSRPAWWSRMPCRRPLVYSPTPLVNE
jgi:hypothetical protein